MIPYMVGKFAPNSTHFTKGLVKYVPGRGYFRVVPSQNGDKFVTSPLPPILERLDPRYRISNEVPLALLRGILFELVSNAVKLR